MNLLRNPWILVLLMLVIVLIVVAALVGVLVWWLTRGRHRASGRPPAPGTVTQDPTDRRG